MASYVAKIAWTLSDGADFLRGRYSRVHTVSFDCGISIPGSASPHVVPAPWSSPDAVDPEETFVAAISSCHMLWFLHKAREAGLTVASYDAEAEGVMGKMPNGRLGIAKVTLRPSIIYVGRAPTGPEADYLHHAAHEDCYVANSVATEIIVEERSDRLIF